MARDVLLDQFEGVLPRVNPAEEARQILGVMARISRADSAAWFLQRGDALRWLTGDPLSEGVATAIRRAWGLQRTRVLTGSSFTERRGGDGAGSSTSRMLWLRRADDGRLDAVYLAGCALRPLDTCADRLLRVAALLGLIHFPPGADQDGDFTKIGSSLSSKLNIE